MLYTTYQSEPHPPASSSSRAGESQAGGLPPIEWLKWPVELPLPTFDQVLESSVAVCGADKGGGRSARSLTYALSRKVAIRVCEKLLGASAIESANHFGMSSRSVHESRRSGICQVADSHAGQAISNEVVYCLIARKRATVNAERRATAQVTRKMLPENNILLGDGDYKAAARTALAGHAGSATGASR